MFTPNNDRGFRALARWHEVERHLKAEQQKWIEDLLTLGAKAIHPDDGWVNAARSTVTFVYPQFCDKNLRSGDLVVLGSAGYRHRWVKLIEKLDNPLLSDAWRFEITQAPVASVPHEYQDWLEDLRRRGVVAVVPKDGWYMPGINSLVVVNPYFDDGVSEGCVVTVGFPEESIYVRLTQKLEGFPGYPYFGCKVTDALVDGHFTSKRHHP